MLFLDKSPILCAKATPYCFYWNIISSFKVCSEISKEADAKVLPQGSLAKCIYLDVQYSFKNLQWYNSYVNELISIHNDIVPHAPRGELTLNTDTILHKHPSYFSNLLKIHSPLLEDTFREFNEEMDNKYSLIKDIIQLSREILIDMQPQLEDFPKGVPNWIIHSSFNTSLQAFDIINRRHIKIDLTDKGFKYYTSIISNDWHEIEHVPKEIDYIVDYLLSKRTTLSLIN